MKSQDSSDTQTAAHRDWGRPLAGSIRFLFAKARWALGITWTTNPNLTVGFVAVYLLLSFLPAAQALATRGLINAAVRELRFGGGGVRPILPWLVLALTAAMAEGLSRLFQDFATNRLHDDLNLELNTRILAHASRLDAGFFEDPASEDILHRAQQDPARHFVRFVAGTLAVFSNLIQIVSLLAIVVAIEPLVLIVLAPATVPYMRFRWDLSRTRYELERSRAAKRRWTQYFVSLLTDASSVPEVKILDLAPLLIRKFRSLMEEFRDQDHRFSVRAFRAAAAYSGLATSALYLLFVRVALRVLAGSSTIGDLAVFGAASARLRSTLEAEINTLTSVQEEMLNVSNLQEMFATIPTMRSAPSTAVLEGCTGEIEFQGVSFSYPGCVELALCDVSLTIRAGETMALVGENGSGKTTLVKLIVRLFDPTAGRVLLDGHDLRDLNPEHLRSRVSFVFQNFGRYEATIAENIGYGDWRALMSEHERVERVASQAGIADMIGSFPKGYETVVGRKFGQIDLSTGQWQRVAVARAFARQTSLLILDEPASNLDPLAEYELFTRFRTLAHGRTTILISHRFSTVPMADRIAVLQRGRIVEVGSHDDLLRKCGHYATLYDRATRHVQTGPPL